MTCLANLSLWTTLQIKHFAYLLIIDSVNFVSDFKSEKIKSIRRY